MTKLKIRELTLADTAAAVALNEAVVRVTSPMNDSRFAALHELSGVRLAVEDRGEVVAFVLAMIDGAPYENGNFSWFSKRLRNFLYVDRVVVSAACRGLGIGGQLYGHIFQTAPELGLMSVCAEMDLDPPNEGSLRFHERAGFLRLGTRILDSGKTVSMQLRPLASG